VARDRDFLAEIIGAGEAVALLLRVTGGVQPPGGRAPPERAVVPAGGLALRVGLGTTRVLAGGGVFDSAPGMPPGAALPLRRARPVALFGADHPILLVIAFARRLALVEIDIGLDLGGEIARADQGRQQLDQLGRYLSSMRRWKSMRVSPTLEPPPAPALESKAPIWSTIVTASGCMPGTDEATRLTIERTCASLKHGRPGA
jgi:hypothetical protein